MIVANPIFDSIFKRLMENKRLATFFISTLIGEEIVELTVRPQEYTHIDHELHLRLVRLDYNAVVRTVSGEIKNVLIEVQKAMKELDLMRFRNYLAEQYKRRHTLRNEEEEEQDAKILPVITIYMLGFNLPEIKAPALKVGRVYLDMTANKEIVNRSYFVERLTHDSYVVQLNRIKPAIRTHLEEMLTIFGQNNLVDERGTLKELNETFVTEEVVEMAEELQRYGSNGAIRKELDNEFEYLRTMDALFGKTLRKLEKTERKLEETHILVGNQEKLIEHNKKELEHSKKEIEHSKKETEHTKKELEHSKKEIEHNKKELENKEKIISQTIRLLLKNGLTPVDIAKQLFITIEEVEKYGQ